MTAPVVRFAGAATLVREYLAGQIDIPVGLRRPLPQVGRVITVVRVGGSRPTTVTESARLILESWAAKPEDAEELAEDLAVIVTGMAGQKLGDVTCYRVDEVARPAYLPGADGTPRFTATYEVHLRGTAA